MSNTMKKIEYGIAVNNKGKAVKRMITGYDLGNGFAVHKDGARWWVIDHVKSGCSVCGAEKRKDAIAKLEELMPQILKPENTAKLENLARKFQAMPLEGAAEMPKVAPVRATEIDPKVCEAIAEIYDRKHPRPEKRIVNPAYKDGGKIGECPEAASMKAGKWATYAQWKKLGYKVIKGQKQTLVSYTDQNGNLRKYGVFHESQVMA